MPQSLAKILVHVVFSTKGNQFKKFYWQGGYGAFSIGESGVEACRRYIAAQKSRHKQVTFQDEFRALCRKYKVPFDEAYMWD